MDLSLNSDRPLSCVIWPLAFYLYPWRPSSRPGADWCWWWPSSSPPTPSTSACPSSAAPPSSNYRPSSPWSPPPFCSSSPRAASSPLPGVASFPTIPYPKWIEAYSLLFKHKLNFFLFLSYLASNLILLKVIKFIIVFIEVEVGAGLILKRDRVGLRHLKLICMKYRVLGSISEAKPNSTG